MPCIVTSIHDPATLAEACRRWSLVPPVDDTVVLDGVETSGWIVRISGLHGPLVFKTLSGLVVYDARDNGFISYARIMRFLLRCYGIAAAFRRARHQQPQHSGARRPRPVFGKHVA